MIVTDLFSLAASLAVLYLFFRKEIPANYDTKQLRRPEDAIKDRKLFKASWVILGILLIAYVSSGFIKIPVSIIAGAVAVVFILMARSSKVMETKRIIKEAPWAVVIFSIGMYVVVYGLKNVGLTDALGTIVENMAGKGLYVATVGMGFLSAALSSIMNNMPTVMIDALAIKGTNTEGVIREALLFANVVGSDLGPKITPIGSLATLLWLHVLSAKGVRITWGNYLKTGVILTVPTLFTTLTGLYLWLHVTHTTSINIWLLIVAIAFAIVAAAMILKAILGNKQTKRGRQGT
jgi:arsenical pump membrane protein